MKQLKLLYLIPIFLSLGSAFLLIWGLFPSDYYFIAFLSVLIPLIILGTGFRIINRQRIQLIRNQLFQILKTLEEFDIDEPKKVKFKDSPFQIFNELNEYLIELIDRIRSSYQANKQFTQNASHELQTPLAIIKGHIEILLQSPYIKEKEVESLAILLQNTNRLSKLNSALILLSKIENQRFGDTELISFRSIVEDILQNFRDLINIQELDINKDFKDDFEWEMSNTLAEILIANLIQNAIRHNIADGFIKINIYPNVLTISNSGKTLKVNPEQLFKRFKRESLVEESLGLGLSIVKRICERSNLSISYIIKGNLHTLEIKPLEN